MSDIEIGHGNFGYGLPLLKVLDVESHNVKALYRQAQAYMETTDLDFAELDVKKALELDNRKQRGEVNTKDTETTSGSMQQRDAKLYSNMFVRMRKETTAEVKIGTGDQCNRSQLLEHLFVFHKNIVLTLFWMLHFYLN
ncbi:hypothetical protein MRB53_028421 [Persea americana]|uniref:Uncharacterized protein n=1 Tax=Persea americana TaxID=3435 RepID=A0ACC2KFY2_PERAE|nr:hypothetical protein MRB53_028421 [Persea americana]